MRIILSPAKKMRVDTDSYPVERLPVFVDRAERLRDLLREMPYDRLKALWKCSDRIAEENIRRLQDMDLRRNLTPAVLAYDGIAYQYMAPGVFTDREMAYVGRHLRILSGFYGVLSPFDGVTPYRLEMGAKLAVDGHGDLYGFWGDTLAAEVSGGTDLVLNLASKEYSQAVAPHLPAGVRFLTVVFGERIGGRVLEKGTFCKMARGEMVRFLAEREAEEPGVLWDFDRLGYRFSPAESDETRYVFLRERTSAQDNFP